MRILIEALGIGVYGGGRSATLNLLRGLMHIDRSNEYVVLLSAPESLFQNAPGNFHAWTVPIRNRFVARFWAQAALPWHVRKQNFDCVHFAKNLATFGMACPSVVSLYDMTIIRYPHLFPRIDVWYWRTIERASLHQCCRIVAISHTTGREVSEYYDIPRSKISLVYPSIDSGFTPASQASIAGTLQHYAVSQPYILHVGSLARKKNLKTLVRAFYILQRDYAFKGQLLFVGADYRAEHDREFYALIRELGLDRSIRLLRHVSDEDLPSLYSGASAVVYLSLHEGFGLAALEAMSCGSALIVSAGGALPEVVDDAALVVSPPTDDRATARALASLLFDGDLAKAMRERAVRRASQFSRERSARDMLAVYQQVVGCN